MSKGAATWKRVKFGEVVRLNKETCKDPASAGIERVIGLEHLEPGDLRVRSWGDVANGTTFTNRVRPGQVLFGKRRAYQRKVAVADFDAICSGDIYVFESANPSKLLPELLPFVCQTDSFFAHAVGTSAGSLSPRTNWSSLAEYEFALPPLEEQRRMVSMFVAAERVLREVAASAEIADTLPDALLSNHLRRLLGTDQPLKFTAPRPPHLLCRAGEVLTARQGLQVAQAERSKEPASGLQPYLTAQYMLHGGDVEYVKPPSPRVVCAARDVLILRTGMTNGTVFTGHTGAFHNNFFAVDYDSRALDRDYLLAYLRHPNVRHLMRTWSGATNIPDLNHGDFYAIPFPLPSLSAQQEIARNHSELKAAAATAHQRVAAAYGLRSRMLQTVAGPA